MKRFKKKHTKLPKPEAIVRLLRNVNPEYAVKYVDRLARMPAIIPLPIRQVCLAEPDPARRNNIRYYPDLHNFIIYDLPNRSLPVDKFLAQFQQFLKPEELIELQDSLTNYRLEFNTRAEDWVRVYNDNNVHSCMSGPQQNARVACYAHPENKLALAALYAPGTNRVIARTIVNTDEKWYVRLYGDKLLVDKLQERGYYRLKDAPKTFKMYGWAGARYRPGNIVTYPYFDFSATPQVLPATYDPTTEYVEVIINPSIY